MACKADMLVHFADYLKAQAALKGAPNAHVFADTLCSVNGGAEGRLFDANIDLADKRWSLAHADWLSPRPAR